MIVYKVTNTKTGMIYVGKTTRTLSERFSEHLSLHNSSSKLMAAIQEHGPENFVIDILDESATTNEELADKEEFYIRELDSVKNGYNISYRSIGGKGTSGKRWDKVSKEERSAEIEYVNKIRWSNATDEHRKYIGQRMKDGWEKKDRSKVVKSYWDKLSPEERRERVRNMRAHWDNMSPEGRAEHARNASQKAAEAKRARKEKKNED